MRMAAEPDAFLPLTRPSADGVDLRALPSSSVVEIASGERWPLASDRVAFVLAGAVLSTVRYRYDDAAFVDVLGPGDLAGDQAFLSADGTGSLELSALVPTRGVTVDAWTLWSLAGTPEWIFVIALLGGLSLLGLDWRPLLLALVPLAIAALLPVLHAGLGAARATFPSSSSLSERLGLRLRTACRERGGTGGGSRTERSDARAEPTSCRQPRPPSRPARTGAHRRARPSSLRLPRARASGDERAPIAPPLPAAPPGIPRRSR